jgi:hypothetical protein
MRRFLQLFSLLLFTHLTIAGFAQQPISGRVAAGDTALVGVTVQVKGTTTSTQTDANGQFTINASPNSTLVFSSVGYESEEVKVGNRSTFDVRLQSSSHQLEQVVVVGYGTQRKATATGAVSAIKGSGSASIARYKRQQ